MCGRFVQDDELNTLLVDYALSGHRFPDYQPRYNIAPTQTIALILEHPSDDGARQRLLGPARWSLVPPWEKTLPLPYSTFNARAEKIATTRTFAGALTHQRALIPTGGYYEWVKSGDTKTPHFIHSTDDAPTAFAAVYSWWRPDGDTAPLCTATILTTDAPDHLAWVHPRTPVFVPPSWQNRWLDSTVEGSQLLVDELLQDQTIVTNTLEAYPVGPVRGEGKDLIARLES
jgi:putative SOS response-associated peptidase YedK